MSHVQPLLKSTVAVDVVKDSIKTNLCKNVPAYLTCVCSTVGQQLQIAG